MFRIVEFTVLGVNYTGTRDSTCGTRAADERELNCHSVNIPDHASYRVHVL